MSERPAETTIIDQDTATLRQLGYPQELARRMRTFQVPPALKLRLYIAIAIAQYLCGLASTSRMIFAFSRDGGLPGSRYLRQVSHRFRSPMVAIWAVAGLSVAFTIYAPVYTTVAAVCVIFLYISYLLPIVAGLFAFRRSWTVMGPFDVGMLYPVVAVLAIIGAAVLLFVGVQPPNNQALTVTIGVLVLTTIIWYGFERKRFQGLPISRDQIAARAALIASEERALAGSGG